MREASQDTNKGEQLEDGPKPEDTKQGIVGCLLLSRNSLPFCLRTVLVQM